MLNNIDEDLKRWLYEYNKYVVFQESNELHMKFIMAGSEQAFEINKNDLKITVLNLGEDFKWMEELDGKSNLYDLLLCIEKEYIKNNINNIFLSEDFEVLTDEHEKLLDFDIEEFKIRKQLEDKYKNLSVAKDKDKLFENNSQILIEEYLNFRKKYKENHSITFELVDDNIYEWKLSFRKFPKKSMRESLDIIKNKFGYDCVEIHLQLHQVLYPNYPPFIKIIKPLFKNNFEARISALKMINLDYWTPCRELEYIIKKLYNIVNTFGEIDEECDIQLIHPIYQYLTKLYALCNLNDDNTLDQTVYQKIYNNTTKNSKITKTSYGHGADETGWDINKYIKSCEEKNRQILFNVQKVKEFMINEPNKKLIYDYIDGSQLLEYVESIFTDTTLLELNNIKTLASELLDILIFMISQSWKNSSKLCKSFKSFVDEIKTINEIDKTKTEDSFYKKITDLYDVMQKNAANLPQTQENVFISSDELGYATTMIPLKFEMIKTLPQNFIWKKDTDETPDKHILRKIIQEISNLKSNLPIHIGSSIFVKMINVRCLRALITGPQDTPYDSGCFIFDIYLNKNYPEKPPLVNIVNSGKIYFNPNLYPTGNICLSLLGTYGAANNTALWNSQTSTILQILISIQGLILVKEPYYNEGYRDSEFNQKKSNTYSEYVKYYTMLYAMNDLLENKNKYAEFEDIITKHFQIKKQYILENCQKWVDNATSHTSSVQHNVPIDKQMFQEAYDKLVTLLD